MKVDNKFRTELTKRLTIFLLWPFVLVAAIGVMIVSWPLILTGHVNINTTSEDK
jgi:hypothetical protein